MNELKQQLDQVEAELRNEQQRGALADQGKITELQEEHQAIRRQLSEIENQQTVETTANEIASSMETYAIGDSSFTLDQLAADEDAAKILRKGIAENSQKQAQKWLEDINAQKSVYEQKLSTLSEQLAEAGKTIDTLQNDNSQLHIENEDLSEKRDAAVRSAEEAQADVTRLSARVDELTQQIAVGASTSNVVVIESDADLEAAAQRLKAKKEKDAADKRAADEAARVRIYGVTQLDGTGAQFGAYRADDDTYLTFGWLEKNKYVELSGEEVERFRQELEAAKQAEVELVPETDKPTELVEEQFRTDLQAPGLQNVDAGHGLDENVTEREDGQNGEGGAVTVEARLTALELAVFGQAKVAA